MTGFDKETDSRLAERLMHALDRASAKLEAGERARSEPIAVVGIGCRLPGGIDSPDIFWQRLSDGFDGIREVPPERWDVEHFYDPDPDTAGKIYTRHGGFLDRVDAFDARFFEIAPREAISMDPQQRLLLEVCWEALEHAGLRAERLQCGRVGVYLGVTNNEYADLMGQAVGCEGINAWFGTGNALNSIAGRVAHTLGLQGPAMAIDTACSSSLVAVHLACQGLRSRETEMALVGGVNLILSPQVMIAICRARMLAADGHCKTFDASADGYARGEGCGVVVLKRLSDAEQNGDTVLAVLRGSAVNQDGPSSGFTVPNGQAQQALIRQALTAAGVAPNEIDYLEAHGTGTSLGDPIEVQAAASVLGENRQIGQPLILGSVKTNIGHLEAAAGIAGLIKTVLAIAHSQIPPHLHFQNPNPHISWQHLPVEVTTDLVTWPARDHPRRASLSSFGVSGTNAHIVVEQAPELPEKPQSVDEPNPLHLLLLSAKTPQALRNLAERYMVALTDSRLPLADICYTAHTGRSHFVHRLAILAKTPEQAGTELEKFLRQAPSQNAIQGTALAESCSCGLDLEESQSREQQVRCLAEHYTHGGEIDWQFFGCDVARRRVSLPTYPWQRQRYWFEPAADSDKTDRVESSEDTATLSDLRHGDVATLARRLEQNETFTEAESILIPRLLQAVVQQHRHEQTASTIDQWLYQVEWRSQLREGLQPSPDFIPQPDEIYQRLHLQASKLTADDNFRHYWQGVVAAEALSAEYVVAALSRMGVDQESARLGSTPALLERLGIDRGKQPLFERLLKTVAESNPHGKSAQAISDSCRALLARYPSARIELTLLDRCGSQLVEVLQGRCDPLQLLFPENSDDTVAQLYENSPGAHAMSTLVQTAIATAVAQLPADRKLRVLEIGAGTGSTSSSVLSILPEDRYDYFFTDISPHFTTAARAKFEAYSSIDYRTFDIEHPAESQGITPGQFDIVLAANVLHATRDLQDAVRHARQLLTPGGLLVLLEGTQPMCLLDCIFGLTDGWWRFSDHPLRTTSPLLSAREWEQLLLASGFDEAVALEEGEQMDSILSTQSVVVARASNEKPPSRRQRPAQHWIILSDRSGVGQCLGSLAKSAGDTVTEFHAADHFAETDQNVLAISPDFLDQLQEVVTSGTPAGSQQRIVHLWNLDAVESDNNVVSTEPGGCRSVLTLTQRLTDEQWTCPTQLCLVTRQAMTVVDDDNTNGLFQAPLWGMARVIAAEHPELTTRRVDLDRCDPEESARLLFDELQSADAEDEVAFRGGSRWVPRFVRASPGTFDRGRSPLTGSLQNGVRGDGSYLITGGLGGLGLLIAESMVRQGARHLILAGRSAPTAAAAALLGDLEQRGARITVCQLDVSLREDMALVLDQITKTSLPLRGVIHAAGVLDDGVVRQLCWRRFAGVLAPKVDGAWYLHELTQDMPLDFFLLFSSATSLLGSPGQANHAAANAFLDALAYYRRARGLPALSINWGAWAEIGSAASSEVSQRIKQKGIGRISPELGLACLQRFWDSPIAQVAVVPIDWSQQSNMPLLFSDHLAERNTQAVDQHQQTRLAAQLLEVLPHRRRTILLDFVRRSVASVLGLDAATISPGDGFMELGMDSLSSIELRNRLQNQLQTNLPSTVAFDFPTAQQLVDFLIDQQFGDKDSPVEERPGEVCTDTLRIDSLQDLSVDELGALIDEELNTID